MAIKHIEIDRFTGDEYWVLVYCDRQNIRQNGEPVRPIDMPYGMLVFSSMENAMLAAKEQHRLYGIVCRPQLLIPPPENHCTAD